MKTRYAIFMLFLASFNVTEDYWESDYELLLPANKTIFD